MQILDDRYELSKELGRGSSGTVWEARDRATSETVAVKVLEPHLLASKNAKKRFVREVETAGALRHAHVVEVYGHGETADGGAYLVMERLEGKTLAARLREIGPLPQPRAIKIIAQVLEAVLSAHRLGVVHRDLKPSNVMLIERDGDSDFVKVCDFGLAKDIESDSYDPVQDGALAVDLASVTTEHGHICGTPEYMAPEQARGETVDERADLYAVAVMLFQAVVGRPPFSARSPLAVVSLHLTATPPRPSELRPDLRIFPPLENLILRGLAKDRAERPSSAEVFRADLLQLERDYARWSGKRGPRPTSSASVDSATVTLAPTRLAPTRRGRILAVVALGIGAIGVVSAASWRSSVSSSSAHAAGRPSTPFEPSVVAARAHWQANEPAHEAARASMPGVASAASASPAVAEVVTRRLAPSAVKPKNVPPRSLLEQANDALAEGRVAEACSLGEKASSGPGASPALWKFLGQCFMRLGEREKGIAYYRRYLEVSPSSPDAVFVREMIK